MAKEQTPETGNLYSLLGLNRGATDEQVRTAYYRLAKSFHPDGQKSSEKDGETFNDIVRAAAILRDPARRKLYDRGAIDEEGAVARSRGRWSYRELVLACLTAVITVLASVIAFYSLDNSGRALSSAETQSGRQEKSSAVPDGTTIPVAQSNEPVSVPRIDGSVATLSNASPGQQAAYSAPETMKGSQSEFLPPVIAAAPGDSRDHAAQKNSLSSKKPAAAKQKSKIPLSSSVTVLSSYSAQPPRTQSECSLTSAARNILAGIISH